MDAIQDYLEFNLARTSEQFKGMNKGIICQSNELVDRDTGGIVDSVIQGSDQKTKINTITNSMVFYLFGIKKIPLKSILPAATKIDEIFSGSCEKIRTTIERIPISNIII